MGLMNVFGDIGLDSSLNEIKRLLVAIVKPLSQVTGSGSNRLSIDVNAVTGTVGTVTTVTTVATVTNQTNIGGVSAFELQKAMSHQAFANSIRPVLSIRPVV
jgi:hypothetical protein